MASTSVPGALRIRLAGPADIAAMHRVRTSVRENRLSDPGRIGPADYQAILDTGGRAWVAEIEDRVVGFAAADVARCNVWALFIDPAWEARGIGRRLHDALVDWLLGACDAIWLTTAPGTRAAAFYGRAGWAAAGTDANGELRFELTREAWAGPASARVPCAPPPPRAL